MNKESDPISTLVNYVVRQIKDSMPIETKIALLRACGQVVISEIESAKFLSAAEAFEIAQKRESELLGYFPHDVASNAPTNYEHGAKVSPQQLV